MKSEKEKMLAGEYYNAGDEILVKERDHARNLAFEFNHTKPSQKEKRHSCKCCSIRKSLQSYKKNLMLEIGDGSQKIIAFNLDSL